MKLKYYIAEIFLFAFAGFIIGVFTDAWYEHYKKEVKKSEYYVMEIGQVHFPYPDSTRYIQFDVAKVTLNDGYKNGDTVSVTYKAEDYIYPYSYTFVIVRKIKDGDDDVFKQKIIYEKKLK